MSNASIDPRKIRLEQAVAEAFLPPYNLATRRDFVVLRAGEPPEPDVLSIDRLTGEQIGIEVGTVYYDAEHARATWERARGRGTDPYHITRPDRVENVRVLARALRIIRAKARKLRENYHVPGRLLLTVFTYPIRFYLAEVERHLQTVCAPVSHPFDEIYVVSQHGEVYRLFPDPGWLLR